METTVFLAVLLAALLHAAWNVQIKLNLDTLLALFLLQIFMALFGLGMMMAVGLPAREAVPYALVSGALHTAYNLFLVRAYRHGDLSLVYPLARGTAPLLTLLGSLALAQDVPSRLAILGIIVLITGLLATSLSSLSKDTTDRTTIFYALGTAAFIAAYTVVDGLGGRVSGAPIAYSGLVFVLDGTAMVAATLLMRGPAAFATVAPLWKPGLAGGAAQAAAYAIVIWAMAKAPIPMVAALRETSIIFAMLLSARLLKEHLTWIRVVGGLLIVAGAIFLRLG